MSSRIVVARGPAFPAEVTRELEAGGFEVCFLGTGYSSFMELPGGGSPIRFTYTPHANACAVAEFSIAQMIDMVRGITGNVAGIQAGRWSEEAKPSMIGARVGVAGLGHVGREVARMARAAFGAEVFYWNRTRRPELEAFGYTEAPSLTDLFETADIVSANFAYEPGVNDGVIGEGRAHGARVNRADDRGCVDRRVLHRADAAARRRPLRPGRIRP